MNALYGINGNANQLGNRQRNEQLIPVEDRQGYSVLQVRSSVAYLGVISDAPKYFTFSTYYFFQTLALDEASMKLVPTDPLRLSYWAANNIYFEMTDRLHMLQEDNLILRLKTCLDILEQVGRAVTFL